MIQDEQRAFQARMAWETNRNKENEEKVIVRKAFAKGEATRKELLKAEISAYHGEGTCTFYGTANSNQMLMEIMGLHLPGSAFVHPHSDLRNAYNVAATQQAISISRKGKDVRSIGRMIDERSFVNAIIGLHATGGSTNHTLHLPAMAAAAAPAAPRRASLRWRGLARYRGPPGRPRTSCTRRPTELR